jgi:lipopolysaccharide export system protein LptA
MGLRSAVTAAIILLVACGAAAEEGSLLTLQAGDQPIEIEAKTMELRGNEGLVIFEGSVVAVRGDLTLTADRIEVLTAGQERQIERVDARGGVRIKKGDVVASGGSASYDVKGSVIVLIEKPTVWRGRDAVDGDRIEFHIDDGRVFVENARAIIHTESGNLGGPR